MSASDTPKKHSAKTIGTLIAYAMGDADCQHVKSMFKDITGVDVKVKCVNGEFVVTDPLGDEYKTGLVRKQ